MKTTIDAVLRLTGRTNADLDTLELPYDPYDDTVLLFDEVARTLALAKLNEEYPRGVVFHADGRWSAVDGAEFIASPLDCDFCSALEFTRLCKMWKAGWMCADEDWDDPFFDRLVCPAWRTGND